MSFTDLDVKTIGALATGTLAPGFDFADNGQLEVWLRDESVAASPTETLQTITTHYTLTGNPATNAVMVTTPNANQRMILKRTTPLTQELDIQSTQNFPNVSVEAQFDRVTHMVAEMAEKLKRSLKFMVGTSASDDRELPEPDTGKYLGWDANGNIVNQTQADASAITTTTWSESLLDDSTAAAGRATLGLDGASNVLVEGDLEANLLTSTQLASRGSTENLRISDTKGATIESADGTAFSAANPGYVHIHRLLADGIIRLKVTANVDFDDASGTSDIIGEEFGVTTGIAWGEDRPFYLYAVNSDNTDSGLEFAISPNPSASRSPGTTNNGYKGNPAATPSDINFFFLTSTDVTLTHGSKPAVLIGGIRMTMDSSDDWTAGTINNTDFKDGIRSDPFVGDRFVMPQGQMGADANSVIEAGSDTAPTWATPASIVSEYFINLDGSVYYVGTTFGAGTCTNGVGTGSISLATPYAYNDLSAERSYVVLGRYSANGQTVAVSIMTGLVGTPGDTAMFLSNTNFGPILPNDFTAGTDDIYWNFRYQAFGV